MSSANGDTPDMTLDAAGTLLERTIALPGGAIFTDRVTGADVWSYPNIHGDITATWTAGTVATAGYDPFGNQVTGTVPDNAVGGMDWGWLGQHQRGSEHQTGITPVIEMGARIYNPTLGRFQAVDPVQGGNNNDYTYPNDPVNQFDLNGNAGTCNWGQSTLDSTATWQCNFRNCVTHRWAKNCIKYANDHNETDVRSAYQNGHNDLFSKVARHRRGLLQIAGVIVGVGCGVVTFGGGTPACTAAGVAVATAGTVQSIQDNWSSCRLNIARDTVLNWAAAGAKGFGGSIAGGVYSIVFGTSGVPMSNISLCRS